jgi:hypothetical protein
MSISSKPELDIDLRHDYIHIIDAKVSEDAINALAEDLEELTFNCQVRQEEETKEW